MTTNETAYIRKIYLAMALDPVHVGTRGGTMGRVDNPIYREPQTQLPIIPATSISGTAKSFVTLHYSSEFRKAATEEKPRHCAEDVSLRYCTSPDCPVCVTFGYPQGEKGKKEGFPAMCQFFDARILFFPVHSMSGPLWVTSMGVLQEFFQALGDAAGAVEIEISSTSHEVQTVVRDDKINLGWLLLKVGVAKSPLTQKGRTLLAERGVTSSVMDRVVLVSDKLFGHVVNSNLEVRTLTAIDPITGSTKEGALFTQEAIPRTTFFWFPIVYKDPRNFQMDGQTLEKDALWVMDQVERGMRYYEALGIGGKVTRGMGRIRILNL